MREKEKIIIEAGMKLFASKGFSSTSIQEIATESGISKGAFYLHFKSKDELLLAILEYIFETVNSSISIYEQQNLSPRDKFIKQLSSLFGTFLGHKEFIIMLSKEQAIPRNDKIKNLMFNKHYENHLLFREGILSIYGKDVEAYTVDLALILEGLFNAYMRLMFFEQHGIDFDGLTQYLMRRLDSIVKEITFEKPFLTEDKLKKVLKKSQDLFENVDIHQVVQKMKEELSHIENKEALEISLDVLEEEIKKESPRIPVIKGMLFNFKEVGAFKEYTRCIASYYGFED
ncbi:TetR/AcrR family transcriptional regulator [Paenibacillus sp. BSR1-1]|uniref:TetR/AcrR family transcriptional regulator n=1 Tax=Paenibacillus sp. BSR1-1 TaxID=3020845 RepID=UPI0025AF60FE|nr:TetR/AcrR family transcriptional regulator [Paenibacillus sp. BSR1-1]MDN3016255.1 TetR/AcrR family transcriptional regulator [Paenibacillus sp. BSR1-1]